MAAMELELKGTRAPSLFEAEMSGIVEVRGDMIAPCMILLYDIPLRRTLV